MPAEIEYPNIPKIRIVIKTGTSNFLVQSKSLSCVSINAPTSIKIGPVTGCNESPVTAFANGKTGPIIGHKTNVKIKKKLANIDDNPVFAPTPIPADDSTVVLMDDDKNIELVILAKPSTRLALFIH